MVEPVPSRRLEAGEVLGDPLVGELLGARLVGVLASFDDERIHAVPMWFAHVGHHVYLATGSRSRKVQNLRRDSRATLVVHDSRSGFEVCGASLAGRAEVVVGEEARSFVELVHARYVDPDADPESVREFLDSDDVAIRFTPKAALTWDERGSPASDALRESGGALPLVPTDPRP
jgi:nitroimidazol reductase NimA-like FMN-containing flavoprotein (pyridoxamine 5'-phosphate oxidase superfamily)